MSTASLFSRRVFALFATTICLAQGQASANLVFSSVGYNYGNPQQSGNGSLLNFGVASGTYQGSSYGSTWTASFSTTGNGTSTSQQADYALSISTGGSGIPTNLGFGGSVGVLSTFQPTFLTASQAYYASMYGSMQIHLGTGDSLSYQITGDVSGYEGGTWSSYYNRTFRSPGDLTAAGDYSISLASAPTQVFGFFAVRDLLDALETGYSISISVHHFYNSTLDDQTTVIIDPGVNFSNTPSNPVPEPSTLSTAVVSAVVLFGCRLIRRGKCKSMSHLDDSPRRTMMGSCFPRTPRRVLSKGR